MNEEETAVAMLKSGYSLKHRWAGERKTTLDISVPPGGPLKARPLTRGPASSDSGLITTCPRPPGLLPGSITAADRWTVHRLPPVEKPITLLETPAARERGKSSGRLQNAEPGRDANRIPSR